jgi:hypothetical protein
MHFIVQHDTYYRYSVPIVLAPHVLRLPVAGGYYFGSSITSTLDFAMRITTS